MPAPQDCTSKNEVRAEIDRLDQEIIALFGERFSYVRRMAELKADASEADDPSRVDDVLAKVVNEAEAAGLDGELMRSMWRLLVDWNIAWERGAIGSAGK